MAQRKKDEARQWTDKKLEDMEAEIAGIYKKSTKDIVKKWNSYMEKTGKKIASYQEAYNKALASNDADAISEAYDALYKAKYNQTLGSEYYQDMVNATTAKLAQVNQLAVSYANNQMPSVYMQNFNFTGAGTHKLLLNNGIQFNLIDEATVKRRITDGDIKLPKKKVDIPKDKRWNTKQLNSAVTQGIIQGESMKDIAKRILPVVDNNEKAAIRNTRTMVTGAECQGRVDRYKDLQKRGAIIKKVWMATADSRTRDWHLSMDGQEKELDEDFIDGNGDKIEYPGDPSAEPKTVYNCRCAIASHILGFRKADGHIDWIDEDETDQDTFHETEIGREKSRRVDTASTNNVLGVDINKKHYEHFSDDIKSQIPLFAERISKRLYPSVDELFDLYPKAKTPEDKLLLKFLNDSQTYIQSYKDFSDDVKKQYAEIFSVLNTPSTDTLFRGESGTWVEHYGEFEKGKTISFDSISFTTSNNTEAMSSYDVLFEFEKGTPSIYTANQAWDDVLILGNFEIVNVETLANGQKHIILRYVK